MTDKQSAGRKANAATPADRPTPTASDAETKRTGKESTRRAGPDGPDATEVGNTFKAR